MFAPSSKLRVYRPQASFEGLRVNGINFVIWSDIADAKRTSVFGFPYILISLKRRRPPFFSKTWWVPLYLGKLDALCAEVEAYCPKGHPFREVLLK